MYSEGIDRLTVYGSSNVESKLQKKLHEDTLYSVYFVKMITLCSRIPS